jgi:hypothetical protein
MKDGREHIDYVPTQVVTEYFRHVFKDGDGQPVKGILYPSARQDGGVCCVLFFEADQCGGKPDSIILRKRDAWLELDKNSRASFIAERSFKFRQTS